MLPAAYPCAATPRKRSPNTHPLHSALSAQNTAGLVNGLTIGWPLSRPRKYVSVMLPAAYPCAATPRKRSPNTHP